MLFLSALTLASFSSSFGPYSLLSGRRTIIKTMGENCNPLSLPTMDGLCLFVCLFVCLSLI